ncbi:hypothetical protein [Escherichia coli]|uniref:hypothetical protein n=1 Tax=Escherichia coli TaxID=562 RepID=UPI0039847B59
MSRDPPQRREARFAKRRCPLHPGGLLPGCRERRPRRDRGGATGTVAASQGFASGMEARQGGDSFAGSVHDSPPHQGDASAWPASLPAGVSLPGVFARADRRPPPPALYHLFLLPCKM